MDDLDGSEEDMSMDDDALMDKIKAILGPDVDEEKLQAICSLLKAGMAQDDPPQTPGAPVSPNAPGAPRIAPLRAMDSARSRREFDRLFPDAPKVRHI